MASILSLPDECLCMIVSCIDDPSSFFNMSLTCKSFQKATTAKSALNTKLLKAKAEYYVKSYIVATSLSKRYISTPIRDKFNKLMIFLRNTARFTATKELVTYDKVIDAWQRNGPVAAKLLTWLRNKESTVEKNIKRLHSTETSSKKNWSITLHLPGCEKTMIIKTSYFVKSGNLLFHSTQTNKQIGIQIKCGDIDVTAKFSLSQRSKLKNYMYWTQETLGLSMKPIKAAIEVLQREIGETDPPMCNYFFIWLCCGFFPEKCLQNRLFFKDTTKNTKPTPASVQTAVEQFHKFQQFELNLQKLLSEWKRDEDENSKHSVMIAETVHLLALRSEAKILARLYQDAPRFFEIATFYYLRQLPKQCLLDLVLRTSLEESAWTPTSIAKNFVKNRLSFKCLGGNIMKVCGFIQRDTWCFEKLEIEFTLPDGEVLKLEAPFEIETLNPVTKVLMGSAKKAMQGEENIPEMNNFRTAVYFLYALKFSEAFNFAFNSSDRMTPISRYPESEEESPPRYSYSPVPGYRQNDD